MALVGEYLVNTHYKNCEVVLMTDVDNGLSQHVTVCLHSVGQAPAFPIRTADLS